MGRRVIDEIAQLINGVHFLNIRARLEQAGFKVTFDYAPCGYYSVKRGGESFIIAHKDNVDSADLIVGDFAIGKE